MAWKALTFATMQTTLGDAEMEAAREQLLASGQADPLDEVLENVVAEVRGRVAARAGNTLEGDVTLIPPELLQHASYIARWRLLGRLGPGAAFLLTENRRKDYDDAIAALKDVARGDFTITPATTAADPATSPNLGGGGTIARQGKPKLSNIKASGLI